MQLLDLNTTPCPVHDDAEQLQLAVAAGNAALAREDWAERTATPTAEVPSDLAGAA
jgi:hypothetical protein